jgi:hypothetical protein
MTYEKGDLEILPVGDHIDYEAYEKEVAYLPPAYSGREFVIGDVEQMRVLINDLEEAIKKMEVNK